MNKELVTSVKAITAKARGGDTDGAYKDYAELFSAPRFASYQSEEQRQALRLAVHAHGLPQPASSAVIDAHRAAVAPLMTLVGADMEPVDYEMLGMCQAVLGRAEDAKISFQQGLNIEQGRNPASDLCGNLTRRLALLQPGPEEHRYSGYRRGERSCSDVPEAVVR